MVSAPSLARGTRDTFWRSLQTFAVTRIVISVLLLVYLNYSSGSDSRALAAILRWDAGAVYLAFAVILALFAIYLRQRFMPQLIAQLTLDIVAISMLYIAADGSNSGLAILFLFPLAGSAILAPLPLALFAVSLVTIVMVGDSGYQVLRSMSSASTSQAGLYGAAFFAAVYMINRLAARLIKEEDLAARRGRDLHLQEAINRLVVADMADGVLVVGPDADVLACNPAVERMLGIPLPRVEDGFHLAALPALAPIVDAFLAWRIGAVDGSAMSTESCFVMIKPGTGQDPDTADPSGTVSSGSSVLRQDLVAHLKLRFARVTAEGITEDRTVIFMRDVTEIENQAQQLKLASMGRLTASIAHEVRNPLSAISHAASLLREDATDPTHVRLLRILAENVVRLDRMVEDILKLSRRAQVHGEPLALNPALDEIIAEFRESHALAPNLIAMQGHGRFAVRFDPMHLREVLVNLLSNALRYASGMDECIRISVVMPKPGRLELHVQDDGAPITAQVRAHLFEPFYTTSSKGTGLGLYLARELCLNNGAMLDYEFRNDAGGYGGASGRFVITFALDRA